MLRTRIAALAVLTTLGISASGGSTAPVFETTYKINITRVIALDDLEGFGAGDPDFVAKVTIEGKTFTTPEKTGKNIRPNWVVQKRTLSRHVQCRIELIERDFPSADDKCDINPRKGFKFIDFTIDNPSGFVSGSVNGQVGQPIVARGAGDSDKCELHFVVSTSSS